RHTRFSRDWSSDVCSSDLLVHEMVDGRLVDQGWSSPEVHEALDLCLSCKGCLGDCPTGVDMATYKSEVLHQTYRGRLRPRTHYRSEERRVGKGCRHHGTAH